MNIYKRSVIVSHKPHFSSKNVKFYEFEFGTRKRLADVQLAATHSVRKMLHKIRSIKAVRPNWCRLHFHLRLKYSDGVLHRNNLPNERIDVILIDDL